MPAVTDGTCNALRAEHVHRQRRRSRTRLRRAGGLTWPAWMSPARRRNAESAGTARAAMDSGARWGGADRRLPCHRLEPTELSLSARMAGKQLTDRGARIVTGHRFTRHPRSPTCRTATRRCTSSSRLVWPGAGRVLCVIAAGVADIVTGRLRAAGRSDSARDRKRLRRDRGSRIAGRDLFRGRATGSMSVGSTHCSWRLALPGCYAARQMRGTRGAVAWGCCLQRPSSPSRPGWPRASRCSPHWPSVLAGG